jgi:alkylation response protein AidB-like acyl-CoA dehydrogenase
MTVKVEDAPVNGVQRGCHLQNIIEATSEIQQLVIARAISGMRVE